MDYSISVVSEKGKNYFLACYEDMRFLFQHLDACSFISVPECDTGDSFEVRRNGCIIMAGDCYNWYQKSAVFLIRYSEVEQYSNSRNDICPCETLFAEDFELDDMIFSNVNVHDLRVRALLAVMSFMQQCDEDMYSFQNGSRSHNVALVAAANQSFIARVDSSTDALGIQTFIVPIGF